jgi:hypothetical protein
MRELSGSFQPTACDFAPPLSPSCADSVEVRPPQSATATERFWKEFTRFPGNQRDRNPAQGVFAHGTWTCQPLDTPESSGQYFDNEGSVAGTWTLERASTGTAVR